MNEKLARLKKNIKHYTPELIVGASVAAGLAASVYIYRKYPEFTWQEQTDAMMKNVGVDTGSVLRIETSQEIYQVMKTPKE